MYAGRRSRRRRAVQGEVTLRQGLTRVSRIVVRLALIGVALVMSACSWGPTQPADNSNTAISGNASVPGARGDRIAELATEMIGVSYLYGGTTPRGFDCSGLVYYTHRQVGVNVPRTSAAQLWAAKSVSLNNAQPGDLVFFRINNKISHVGIYVGDGQFIHAPQTGRTVSMQNLEDAYYRDHFVKVGRLAH